MTVIQQDPVWDAEAPLRPEWEEVHVGVRRVWFSGAGGARVPALFVADRDVRAGAVFQHAATAGPEWALPEARALAAEGIASLLVTAPFARPEPHRIVADWGNPASVRAAYLQSILDAQRGVEFLVREIGVKPGHVGYVGKNLGGALAGGFAAREHRVAAVVTIASITRISRFWATADKEEARRRRAQYGQAAMDRLSELTAEFDLAGGASADCDWLLQFGTADGWTPRSTVDQETASLTRVEVRWYAGGHDLTHPGAEADRRAFLAERLA